MDAGQGVGLDGRVPRGLREAVRIFGRNQVSTYILVGLGEDPDQLVSGAAELIEMGVYPSSFRFVRLPARWQSMSIVRRLRTGMYSKASPDASPRSSRQQMMLGSDQKAGCAACGACSVLQNAGG